MTLTELNILNPLIMQLEDEDEVAPKIDEEKLDEDEEEDEEETKEEKGDEEGDYIE